MKKYICNRYRICRENCVRREPHRFMFSMYSGWCREYGIKVKDIEVKFQYYMEKKINEKAERDKHAELPC